MKSHIPKDMTPEEIRCKMLLKRVTPSSIARDVGVTPQSVSRIIDGKGVSDRVRQQIAARLGIDVARIWPQTYLTGGPRKPGRPYCEAAKGHFVSFIYKG